MVKDYVELLFARGYIQAAKQNGQVTYKYNGKTFKSEKQLENYIRETETEENLFCFQSIY
jgi:hypothetical protein